MLNSNHFAAASVLIALGSFALGFVLVLPSPLDAVLAYEQTDVSTSTPYRYQTLDTALLTVGSPFEEDIGEVLVQQDTSTSSSETDVFVAIAEETDHTEKLTQPYNVPFFSQFDDISPASWKKVGCGIASLAMLIEFYEPGKVQVDTLLNEGINANAYLDSAGWTYAGLISISKKYGVSGRTQDHGSLNTEDAYQKLVDALKEGPVMASVHYTFEPTNPIPHLVVITGVENGMVYYNDPAEEHGGGSLTAEKFKRAWKKRYIEFFPS